jgi:hypothetical protein
VGEGLPEEERLEGDATAVALDALPLGEAPLGEAPLGSALGLREEAVFGDFFFPGARFAVTEDLPGVFLVFCADDARLVFGLDARFLVLEVAAFLVDVFLVGVSFFFFEDFLAAFFFCVLFFEGEAEVFFVDLFFAGPFFTGFFLDVFFVDFPVDRELFFFGIEPKTPKTLRKLPSDGRKYNRPFPDWDGLPGGGQ